MRKAAFNADRPVKEGVLEWVRLCPDRIVLFFNRLENNVLFRASFIGYYDSMRCLFNRTTDSLHADSSGAGLVPDEEGGADVGERGQIAGSVQERVGCKG